MTGAVPQGRPYDEDSYLDYEGRIPIVATTLEMLREHGHTGPAFWCFGRPGHEPLLDAIGTPQRDGALARARQETQRRQERMAAERESKRPRCQDCGQPFTDERWKAVEARDWHRRPFHPDLCKACAVKTDTAQRQAKAAEKERLKQEQLR